MQYELSYWERETFLKNIDVAVLGSGLVGLSAAIRLKETNPALKVVVLERGAMPIGASTRNAGFACFGSMTELLDDMQNLPADAVWQTVERRWKGLQRLRQTVGDDAMDYKGRGGYEMFTEQDEADFVQCRDKMAGFNAMTKEITGVSGVYTVADDVLPRFGFKGVNHLILNRAEGQIDTGKMMAALLDRARHCGAMLWNGIDIHSIAETDHGVRLGTRFGWHLEARKALVCTNGFAARLLPNLPVVPARNQVLITPPIPGLAVEGCFHYDRGYYYFRNIDGRILLGGGRNLDRTGETTDEFGSNETIRAALLNLLHQVVLPGHHIEPEMWWTGILGLGPVKKPIVEMVSPNVAVAVRLSGMGVAIGALVGSEGADLIAMTR